MTDQLSRLELSDGELIERAQDGDSAAFGELWTRHYRSAVRVARQFTTSIDADDLVSEAYTRIYQRVLAGGGPTGAFRPYLYTTIRNLASSWGSVESRSVNVEEIEDAADQRIPEDPAAWALDRTLTARAFRSLPDRWQTVLWYTEVEGLDPHEVAPIMGLTANGVAALSYRAREGLRTAWLQAHVSDATSSGECRWSIARLGEHARKSLTERERARLEQHLAGCAKCTIIAEEVEEVGSHLALVLMPLILGGAVGGAVLSQLALPGVALAATVTPALPASIAALGAGAAASGGAVVATVGTLGAAGSVGAGAAAGASVGAPSVFGGIAMVAVLGGSAVLGVPASDTATTAAAAPAVSASAAAAPGPPSVGSGGSGLRDGGGGRVRADGIPAGLADGLGGTNSGVSTGTGSVTDGVTGVGDTDAGVGGTPVPSTPVPSTPVPSRPAPPAAVALPRAVPSPAAPAPVSTALTLGGRGTPGAGISVKGKGGTLATTAVASDGTWSVRIADVSRQSKLSLTQDTKNLGNAKNSSGEGDNEEGGLLSGVLGAIVPLTVTTNSLGIAVEIKR